MGLAVVSSAAGQSPLPATYTAQPTRQASPTSPPSTDLRRPADPAQVQYDQALMAQMRRAAAEQGANETFAQQAYEAQKKYLAETAEKSFREEQFPQAFDRVQRQRQAMPAAQPRTMAPTQIAPQTHSVSTSVIGSGVREDLRQPAARPTVSVLQTAQAAPAAQLPTQVSPAAATPSPRITQPASSAGSFQPSAQRPEAAQPKTPVGQASPAEQPGQNASIDGQFLSTGSPMPAAPRQARVTLPASKTPAQTQLSNSFFAPPVHVAPQPTASQPAEKQPTESKPTVIRLGDSPSFEAPVEQPLPDSAAIAPATPLPQPNHVASYGNRGLQDRIANVLARSQPNPSAAQRGPQGAAQAPPTVFVPSTQQTAQQPTGDYLVERPSVAPDGRVVPTAGQTPVTEDPSRQRAQRLLAQMASQRGVSNPLGQPSESLIKQAPALSPPVQPQPTQPVAFSEPAGGARPLSEAPTLPRLQAPQGTGTSRIAGRSVSILSNRAPNQDQDPAPAPGGDFEPAPSALPNAAQQEPRELPLGNQLRQDPTSRLDQIDEEQRRRMEQLQEDLPLENIEPANPMRVQEPATGLRGSDVLATRNCDTYRDKLLSTSIRDISMDISPMADKQIEDYVAISRTWTDRRGNVVATGTMVDLRRGHVLVDTDQGRVRIPYALLSDSDWSAISDYWRIPDLCSVGGNELPQRNWTPQTFHWTASALCHKPLYFENVQLERYGHTHGPVLQPVHSTAHFFVSLFALPYQTAIHPPSECMYALGYYRPGNCAPWLKDPVPISLDGIRRQALFTVGMASIP